MNQQNRFENHSPETAKLIILTNNQKVLLITGCWGFPLLGKKSEKLNC
jgi:hypothetical protein